MQDKLVHTIEELCRKAKCTWSNRYSQIDDMRLDQDSLTAGGWCFGMVTHWLGYRALRKDDFWKMADSDIGVMKFRHINAIQSMVKEKGGHQKHLSMMSSHTRIMHQQYGLQLHAAMDREHTVDGYKILRSSGVFHGSFIVLILEGPKGGHATALHRDGNNLVFFDPNFGEFHFTGYRNASRWLDLFIKKAYQKERYTSHILTKYGYSLQNTSVA